MCTRLSECDQKRELHTPASCNLPKCHIHPNACSLLRFITGYQTSSSRFRGSLYTRYFRISRGSSARPLKLDQLFHPPPPIKKKIRMLKNKAQVARESIKTTLEFPGPLMGPWTLAEGEFGSALVICVLGLLAHKLFRPPPPK